ncbi:MAG: hypothetical protein ACRCX2_22285 [Paraclostridium sp.]
MKTNPYKGVSFASLTHGIEDDRCALSMNLIAHNDGFLQRRNSIVWVSHSIIDQSHKILTASTIKINGTDAIAYLILESTTGGVGKLYMLVKIFNGTFPQNREIKIPVDETIVFQNTFFGSFGQLQSKIISVQFPLETGLIISADPQFIESKKMYIIFYDAKTQSFIVSNYALPSDFSKSVTDLIVSKNNSSLGWTIVNGYDLIQIGVSYDTNSKRFTAFLINKINAFAYSREYGKMNAIIELSETTLIGTDKNILKINATITPGTPPTTSYSLGVAVFGAGIDKNGWIITNQNTLFCYGGKRFHNFPIEALETGNQSIFVKNQPEYQFSVQELENLGLIIFPGSVRIFQSNRYGLIEIVFGSNIKNNYTQIYKSLASLDSNCSEYFNVSNMQKNMFTIIFNPYTHGVYPIDRAELAIASATNSVNIESNTTSIFPQHFANWYKKDSANGIQNDISTLNVKYFDGIHKPLDNIEYLLQTRVFSSESNDVFLASFDSATIFFQIKETKEDVVYSNTNEGNLQQVQYPIILISKTVDDIENSQDVRPTFTLGFRNCDGMTVDITDRATYMIGAHNMEEPVTYSLSSFYSYFEKMNIMRKEVRATTDLAGRYGNCAGLIFVTRSICVDIVSGLSLSEKTKLSSKPSHY